MYYSKELTIAANTAQVDATTEVLSLTYGHITRIVILFPPGHAGLTYLQVYYHEQQIFPTTPGATYRGGDTVISFPERYPILEEPFEVTLLGWNLDDTYEHTIHVGLYVERPTVWAPVITESVPLPEGIL